MAARKKSTIKGATAKKTAKAAKKSKKKTPYQTHAKVEKVVPTTLEQIWGDDGSYKYGTLDDDEYQSKIKRMSRVDVQAHATQLGVVPVENREMLEKRLMKEFYKHKSIFTMPDPTPGTKDKDVSQAAKDILSEGR